VLELRLIPKCSYLSVWCQSFFSLHTWAARAANVASNCWICPRSSCPSPGPGIRADAMARTDGDFLIVINSHADRPPWAAMALPPWMRKKCGRGRARSPPSSANPARMGSSWPGRPHNLVAKSITYSRRARSNQLLHVDNRLAAQDFDQLRESRLWSSVARILFSLHGRVIDLMLT